MRICERSNSADTKVSEEGGKDVLQAPVALKGLKESDKRQK